MCVKRRIHVIITVTISAYAPSFLGGEHCVARRGTIGC